MKQVLANSRKNHRLLFLSIVCIAENFQKEDADEFLSEIDMLKKIGEHKNIVQMYACVTKTQPYMLIMELVLTGNLLKYLHGIRKIWTRSKSPDSGER